MIKFDNKLELRYSFNDKSSYMDAWVKHRCEKEILSMLRVLADVLDVKMTAHCEPFSQEGGYRVVWPIAGESSRSISVVLNILMQVLTIVCRRSTFSRQNECRRRGYAEGNLLIETFA